MEGNIFVPNFFLEKVIIDTINVIKTITDTGNRDLGTLVRSLVRSYSDNLDGSCYRPSRATIINSFNYQRYVLQLKKCITAEI